MTNHEHDHDQPETSGRSERPKESFEARMEDFRGRVKKAAGELFDDDELRQEGRIDRLGATVKDTLNGLVDRAKEAVTSATTDDDDERRR